MDTTLYECDVDDNLTIDFVGTTYFIPDSQILLGLFHLSVGCFAYVGRIVGRMDIQMMSIREVR